MTKIADKLLLAPPIILLICLASILPAMSIAASLKSDVVGKPQKIHDSEKLQKAMYALVQKAQVQHKLINEWHEKARLEAKKMQAKNNGQNTKPTAAAATRRACQIQLAMERTPEDITIPGCGPTRKTR